MKKTGIRKDEWRCECNRVNRKPVCKCGKKNEAVALAKQKKKEKVDKEMVCKSLYGKVSFEQYMKIQKMLATL
jgi:hypothetical protein